MHHARPWGGPVVRAVVLLGALGLETGNIAAQPSTASAVETEGTREAGRLWGEATVLARQQRFSEAVTRLERATSLYERELGSHGPHLATTLDLLAACHAHAGTPDRALPALERALAVREKALGPHHPHVATSLVSLATFHANAGRPDLAAPLALRALAIQRTTSPGHPALLPHLHQAAAWAESAMLHPEALALRTEALTLSTTAHGPRSQEAAVAHALLATHHKGRGAYVLAQEHLQHAISVLEERSDDAVGLARLLNTLAEVLREKADYPAAAPLYARALSILEQTGETPQGDAATVTQNLALLKQQAGDYPTAERLFRDALARKEQALGPHHLDVSHPLGNLAELLRDLARHDEAEPLYARALAIRQEVLGGRHPLTATVLQNMGLNAWALQDDARAEPLLREAFDILWQTQGPTHPLTANTVRNLAVFLRQRGRVEEAAILLTQVLAAEEGTLGRDHPHVAVTVEQLGLVLLEEGQAAEATQAFRRVLDTRRKVLGPGHPHVGLALLNLAMSRLEEGEVEDSARLLEEGCAPVTAALPTGHPLVATCTTNRALILYRRGDFRGALPLFTQAAQSRDLALGPWHPESAHAWDNVAFTLLGLGRTREALPILWKVLARRDQHASLAMRTGTARHKLHLVEAMEAEAMHFVTAHLAHAPRSPEAAALALTSLMRFKGRGLEELVEEKSAVRRHLGPEGQALLAERDQTRRRLALVLARVEAPDAVPPVAEELAARLARQERELAARSAVFRATQREVTVEAVQRALPRDAALVELARYRPTAGQGARYAAYVLTPRGPPRAVDLGPLDVVDDRIRLFRHALSTAQGDPDPAGRALAEKLWLPLKPLLGRARMVILAPMGATTQVPWAALPTGRTTRVGDQVTVTHVTSGRDLLRMQDEAPPVTGTVLFADPDFGPPRGRPPPSAQRGIRSVEDVDFVPLPGTAAEARAVAGLVPGAVALVAGEAREAALKSLRSPAVLHVAAHGFVLDAHPEGDPGGGGRTRGLSLRASAPAVERTKRHSVVNPMERAGLALAGANTRAGEEDGILYADELAGVDLWGTRLAVLSACETGLGTATASEGLLGLRRALVGAGTQTQVLSLWNVDDDATRDLMTAFYQALRSGQGRAQALRHAQTSLRAGRYTHPSYWSAFVVYGDWRPVDAW
jgi:CHAT domain-containing protein/Tfp pilus assembly protein PilF